MIVNTTGWLRLPKDIDVQGRHYSVVHTNGYYHAQGDLSPAGPLGLNFMDGSRPTSAAIFSVGTDRVAICWHNDRSDAMTLFVNGRSLTGNALFYDTVDGVKSRELRGYVDQAIRDLTKACATA